MELALPTQQGSSLQSTPLFILRCSSSPAGRADKLLSLLLARRFLARNAAGRMTLQGNSDPQDTGLQQVLTLGPVSWSLRYNSSLRRNSGVEDLME